jgi:anti-sigma factor RsiW
VTTPDEFTEQDFQDYLDNRLPDRRRAEVAAYLSRNPGKAAEIEALRLQDDALRALGAQILEEPVPEKLTAVLDAARERQEDVPPKPVHRHWHPSRLVEIAAALFIFVLGGAVGWGGHSQLDRGPSETDLILSNASFAFAAFANDPGGVLTFGPDQDEELTSASEQIFKRPITRPDLSELGFDYRGARILPNERRLVGYFLFQDERGTRVSITIWPSSLPPNPNIISSQMDDVQARFWLEDQLGFAVMSGADNKALDQVAEQVFSFYQEPPSN